MLEHDNRCRDVVVVMGDVVVMSKIRQQGRGVRMGERQTVGEEEEAQVQMVTSVHR